MEQSEYEIMYNAEQSHWWYKGMAAITRSIVESHCRLTGDLRILEAGCGTGAGIALFSEFGTVTGIDISSHAIHFCRRRGSRRVASASVMALPFAGESFDLVTSFDVLYFAHVEDMVALGEFYRVLVPGGKVIIRVPAFDWLRGIHDIKVSTGHRYTLRELLRKLKACNFLPVFTTYANTLLFPMVVFKRLFDRWFSIQKDSDIAINVGYLEKLFRRCLIFESRFIKTRALPFGLSIFCVGEKSIS